MSLIRHGDFLLRDFWPGGLALRPAQVDASQLAAWQIMPNTYHEFCRWARLRQDPREREPARQFKIVHVNPVGPDMTRDYQVSFRVYGFVQAADLTDLGEWDGTEAGAKSASQKLVIGSGGYADQFRAQQQAFANVRRFVMAKALARDPGHVGSPPDDHITLRRRVFLKRTGNMPEAEAADDIRFIPHAVRSGWSVNPGVIVNVVGPDNTVRRGSAYDVNIGDFVEVIVTPDVVKSRQPPRRTAPMAYQPTTFKTHLNMHEIIVVRNASTGLHEILAQHPPTAEAGVTETHQYGLI